MNILTIILLAILGIFSAAIVLFFTLSIPVVVAWKIYRKIRFGISIND